MVFVGGVKGVVGAPDAAIGVLLEYGVVVMCVEVYGLASIDLEVELGACEKCKSKVSPQLCMNLTGAAVMDIGVTEGIMRAFVAQ